MIGVDGGVDAGVVAVGGAADADQAALAVNTNPVTGAGVVTGTAMLEVGLCVHADTAADTEVSFADQRALTLHATLRTDTHRITSAAVAGVARGIDTRACAVGGTAHTGQPTASGLADLIGGTGVTAGTAVVWINLKISAAVTA